MKKSFSSKNVIFHYLVKSVSEEIIENENFSYLIFFLNPKTIFVLIYVITFLNFFMISYKILLFPHFIQLMISFNVKKLFSFISNIFFLQMRRLCKNVMHSCVCFFLFANNGKKTFIIIFIFREYFCYIVLQS